jgi:hypothetical protein
MCPSKPVPPTLGLDSVSKLYLLLIAFGALITLAWITVIVWAAPWQRCRDEVIARDANGLAVFDLIRRHRNHGSAILCAFDLLEIDGEDLRRAPIEQRKHRLARLLRSPDHGWVLNEHFSGDGAVIFKQACKLGCEGIVSKRLGSAYRSGRSQHFTTVLADRRVSRIKQSESKHANKSS